MKKNISLISFILVALLALTACSFGNQFADPVVESTTGTVTPAAPATEEQKEPIVVEYESCLLSFKGEDYEVMVGKTLSVEGGELFCTDVNNGGFRGDPIEVYDPPAAPDKADSGNDNDDDVNTNDGECVTVEWFNEQVESTDTVSELLSELDREYNLNNGDIGGMWTQEQVESDEGYTVPAGSEFHTDLFENVKELPDGVNIVRSQGGWGIYSTSVDYEIPLPNGGGRWITICGEVDNDDAAGGSSSDNPQACLAESDLNNITGGNSPVDAFNEYFESAGWAYGGELDKGETIPEGVVFLGTFPESNIPEGVVNLSDGFIWEVSESVKAPSGGRYVMACGE